MIIVTDIRLPLSSNPETDAPKSALENISIKKSDIFSARLRKMSLDSRHGKYCYVCSVTVETANPELESLIISENDHVAAFEKVSVNPVIGTEKLYSRPVVAGFGPAGMFCACLLAEYGYRPIVLERGSDIDTRAALVDGFWSGKGIDTSSNVQFGEGGAGTFSDGKLVTRINDPLCDYVLERFCDFGAPGDIMYRAKPHIGTDNLRVIVKNMRRYIIELGGEIRFNSPLTDISFPPGGHAVAHSENGSEIETSVLVLACGHSARDTFGMLGARGFELNAKPFSVGFRIEHSQTLIDRGLYGAAAGSRGLPPGEYSLSQKVGDRTVYTFCMCPGGKVVAASSEEGGVVTNGMSMYSRDGRNANSAVAVSVSPADFENDPFRAIDFQREIERRAFAAACSDYRAPAQSVKSFISGGLSLDGSGVEPTYMPGVICAPLGEVLGFGLAEYIRSGITAFGHKIKGFDQNGLLTGPETRTSSPVRIKRNEFRTAEGKPCIYPAGEGAGYAGGISSAAVDGLKTAIRIIEQYKPN